MGTTEFADRLRNLMDESHIKQKELAQRARITEAALSRYLNDGRIPRIDVVANLATVLNTTTDYLLSRTERDDDYRDFFGIKRLVAERGLPLARGLTRPRPFADPKTTTILNVQGAPAG